MAESLARLCASGAGTSSAGKGVENGASGDIARPVGGRALTFRWLLELENLVRGIHGGRPRLLLAFPAARSLTLSPWTPKIWPLEANGHLGLPRTAPKFRNISEERTTSSFTSACVLGTDGHNVVIGRYNCLSLAT